MNELLVDAIDLRSVDSVLVYGNHTFPFLSKIAKNITVARKGGDLSKLVRANSSFTKLIVGGVDEFSDAGLRKLISMNVGLLCFFTGAEERERDLQKYLLANHPWADVWVFDTNVGRIVVTTASGTPDWLD